MGRVLNYLKYIGIFILFMIIIALITSLINLTGLNTSLINKFSINFIFFKSSFSIDRLIYYIILIISGILGGSFGKNLKIKKLSR